jgi:H/ACA ribonucleoprotein complex non-core subunit NAF1
MEAESLQKKFEKLLDDEENSSIDSSASTRTTSSDEDSSSDDEAASTKKAAIHKARKPVIAAKKNESSEDEEDEDEDNPKGNRGQPKYIKTKDEVTLDELPAPERVELVLDPSLKLEKIGRVISKVDKLLVIQSLRAGEAGNGELAPLDEDTILFDANRKSLGKIFEIFGPVTNPFYSIRFGTVNEPEERGLAVSTGEIIHVAQSPTYTKFIFNVDEIRRLRGSDASWSNDNEPPVEYLEYSDDEQEQEAKRALKNKNKKQPSQQQGVVANYSDGEASENDGATVCGDEDEDARSVSSATSANQNNKNYKNRGNFQNNRMNKSQSQNTIANNRPDFGNNKRAFNAHVPKSQTFCNNNGYNNNVQQHQPGNFNNQGYRNAQQQYGPSQGMNQQQQQQQFFGPPHQNMFWQQQPNMMHMHMNPPPSSQQHHNQYPMGPPNFMGGMPMNFNPYMGAPGYFNPYQGHVNPYPQQHQQPPMQHHQHHQQTHSGPSNSGGGQFYNRNDGANRPTPIGPQMPLVGASPNAPPAPSSNIIDKRFVQNPNYMKKSF